MTVGEIGYQLLFGVVGGQNAVVIDPGDEGTEIAQRNKWIGAKNQSAILLTHGHFDHVLE